MEEGTKDGRLGFQRTFPTDTGLEQLVNHNGDPPPCSSKVLIHDAGPVEAVFQAEGVSEFVDGFFFEAILEQETVRRQAIEFFVQSRGRHEGTAATQLGFAEDKGEDRDVEVE